MPRASVRGLVGNEGVAAYVQRIKGSIGYVEYAYAKRNRMAHAQVQNRDGTYVQPDASGSFATALALGEGRHQITAVAKDIAGNTSAASQSTFVARPAPALATPEIGSIPAARRAGIERARRSVPARGITVSTSVFHAPQLGHWPAHFGVVAPQLWQT